ncbi:MAG: hypothetical protein B6D61_10610 [Bacteroidetes bacterium 4484_249]|nr:MAG: hypothetical protein B6D61_10610 [Bacteroidetes bacterium 4484_249]
MRKTISIFSIILSLAFISCNQNTEKGNEETKNNSPVVQAKEAKPDSHSVDIKPLYLTTAEFKKKVWDYESNPGQWEYNGELPCVVDFYADWCKPCKMVAPIMDDLADYYDGRVLIYKVNTDKERELASVFQVKSIPAILFSPQSGKPAMQAGAMSKEQYIKIIDEFILGIKQKTDNNKKQS